MGILHLFDREIRLIVSEIYFSEYLKMKSYLIGICLAVVVATVTADVLELTDSDFDSTLEEHDIALVMFYAPWCGHCKRMKPEFEKAAKTLDVSDPPVTLAKVDCTEAGKDTCGRFEVRGYPTVKIFRNGELSQDYNGPREAPGIIKYMKGQAGPASKELKDEKDLGATQEKADVVIVGLFDSEKDAEPFLKAASQLREDADFAHSTVGKLGKDLGVFLIRPKNLRSKFEDAELKYDGKMEKDALVTWVKNNYHGLCGHRTPDNAKDFKLPLVTAFYDVDYVKNAKGTNYWRNRVMKVAKNFPKLNFAVANENDFQHEADEFGLDVVTTDKPLVGIKSDKGKFVMKDEFSLENFEKFLTDYEAGKIEPHLKSEDVPESNDGPVKVAVAKNFEELVTTSTKDVLIEFYAPWCGHCKSLAPKYDELGEKMAGENVEIVKMDATANDVPPAYSVSGFPTLYWLPSDTKKPESYSGGREVDEFIKFISKKAVKELNKYDRKGKEKKSEL